MRLTVTFTQSRRLVGHQFAMDCWPYSDNLLLEVNCFQ